MGPHLWLVALSTTVTVVGAVIAEAVRLRFSAISSIYGPGGPDLFGSWTLVGLAAEAMALVGSAALVLVSTVAVASYQGVLARGRTPVG